MKSEPIRTNPLGRAASFLCCALLLITTCAKAQDAQETFKLGVLMPFSGAYGIVGQTARRGIEIALQERGNKVLGKPVQVFWEDDESKPQVGVQKASAAIARGAKVIMGSVASPVTLAVMRTAVQNKVILINSVSADDRITGIDKNRYTFRTSTSYSMDVRIVAEYLASSGLRSVYGIGPDAGTVRDAWVELKKPMKTLGIKAAGEAFSPLGTADFSVTIDKVAKSGADGVMMYSGGGDAVSFVKQALAVNLNSNARFFGASTFDETVAAAIGPASHGMATSTKYNPGLSTPRNKAFVAAYRLKFGEEPNSYAGMHYDGASWLLDVIEATKSWDSEKWVDAFEGSVREDSVQGRKVMRKCDHQASQDGLWAEVRPNPAAPGKPILQVVKVVPADKLLDPCGT